MYADRDVPCSSKDERRPVICVVSIHPPGWCPELQSDCFMQSLPQVTVLFSSAPEQSPRVGGSYLSVDHSSREHSHREHQAFTWRAKDTHMASIWHSRGEHLAPTWGICDTHMGSTCGERLELTWSGTHMGNTRYSHGEHVYLHREHMSRLWSIMVTATCPEALPLSFLVEGFQGYRKAAPSQGQSRGYTLPTPMWVNQVLL